MAVTSLLGQPLSVVNIGLKLFAEELERSDVAVVHVEWRPPAGNADVAALLARLS